MAEAAVGDEATVEEGDGEEAVVRGVVHSPGARLRERERVWGRESERFRESGSGWLKRRREERNCEAVEGEIDSRERVRSSSNVWWLGLGVSMPRERVR